LNIYEPILNDLIALFQSDLLFARDKADGACLSDKSPATYFFQAHTTTANRLLELAPTRLAPHLFLAIPAQG
jgi:hypothetical protein